MLGNLYMSELTKILLSASPETKRHTGLPRIMQLVMNRVRSRIVTECYR